MFPVQQKLCDFTTKDNRKYLLSRLQDKTLQEILQEVCVSNCRRWIGNLWAAG